MYHYIALPISVSRITPHDLTHSECIPLLCHTPLTLVSSPLRSLPPLPNLPHPLCLIHPIYLSYSLSFSRTQAYAHVFKVVAGDDDDVRATLSDIESDIDRLDALVQTMRHTKCLEILVRLRALLTHASIFWLAWCPMHAI